MPEIKLHTAPDAPNPPGPFSHASSVGDWVFTSGMGGLDPKTGQVVSDDVIEQTEQSITNTERILAAAGCTLQDVAKVVLYLTDMQDYPRVNAVYEKRFAPHKPARTCVAVSALPVRERMKLMHGVGHRFIATSFGVPRDHFTAALAEAPGVLDAVEVNISGAALPREAARLAAFREKTSLPLYWAKLRMHEDARYDGQHVSHFIKTGLTPPELEDVEGVMDKAGVRGLFEGVVVRIDRDLDLLATAATLARFAAQSGLSVLGAIKLTDASIARCRDDDVDTARLTAEALLAARMSPQVRYVFDTFMDVDRGYFPRNGFIDRMFNPRPALRTYAAMSHLLGHGGNVEIEPVVNSADNPARSIRFRIDGATHVLVSGVDRAGAAVLAKAAGARDTLDLCAGEFITLAVGQGDAKPGLWVLTDVAT